MFSLHFRIQFNRFKGWSKDIGINPKLAICLGIILFLLGSIYLFNQTEFAEVIYLFILASFQIKVLNPNKKALFNQINARKLLPKIQLLETSFLSLPFIGFLIYKQEFIAVLLAILMSILIIFIPFQYKPKRVLKNPFSKIPFEFCIGIRRTIIYYILSCVLTLIAWKVDNFNLGLFTLVVTGFIMMSYYYFYESYWYIWIYKRSTKRFLQHKFYIGILNALLLLMPQSLLLFIAYPNLYMRLIITIIIVVLYVILSISGKYAFYPMEIPIPQSIALALAIIFPPLLFVLIPYFTFKSIQNLNFISTC